MPRHTRFALVALLLAFPIGLIFSAIVFEWQMVESALKSLLTNDGDQPNMVGRIIMLSGLLALPVALGVGLWPMVRKAQDGKRHFYIANAMVTMLVAALMVPTWGELAQEVYRCDVLQIPNCD